MDKMSKTIFRDFMPDKQLFFLTAAIITISIISVYTLSTYTVILFGVSDFHFLIRQGSFGILSLIIIWGLAQLKPEVWLPRLGFSLVLGGGLLMMMMPFLPDSLVNEVGGAKRWIKVAGFSLAPVEFFKIGFVYFLAWSFSRKLGHHNDMGIKAEFMRFIPYAIVFLIVIFLIAVMQNDLGQVVVLSVTLLFMLFFAGGSVKFFSLLLGASFMGFLVIILTADHRIARIKSWWALAQHYVLDLFPESIASKLRVDTMQEPYQISHSLNAIHNGGIFGTGLAEGSFKLGFLSEVHTDFILAGIAEEFGFVGVVIVTILFITLLHRIFRIANRSESDINFLFSIGVGLLLAFAFLINAYGISGLTPIKGISVPLLSYGGSAMIASSIGIGMVLLASKKAKKI